MGKKRYRKLAAVIGTLVIIVTFIVRDVVRESARDGLTTLQNAQAVFLSRSDNSFIMMRVVDLTTDVVGYLHSHQAERESKHLPIFADPLMPAPSLIEIEDSLLLADGLVLQNVESLLLSLPSPIPEEKEYSDLKAQLWVLKGREKKQISAMPPSQAVYATSQQLDEVKSINSEADELRTKALALSERAFSRTVGIRSSLESSYRWKNCIFYFVFSLGVIANLWGTLTGLEMKQDLL
jgi:hypothetical protein